MVLPHPPITMSGSLHRMSTYNTNRRQSLDWKDAQAEHREGKKPKKEGKGTKTEHTGHPSVLCPLPILSFCLFCVDEYAQGSPFREFLL